MALYGTTSGEPPRRAPQVRGLLAGLRRDMLTTIKDRLARNVTAGDLTAPPAGLDAIARLQVDSSPCMRGTTFCRPAHVGGAPCRFSKCSRRATA
jgi:hypothetical protein